MHGKWGGGTGGAWVFGSGSAAGEGKWRPRWQPLEVRAPFTHGANNGADGRSDIERGAMVAVDIHRQ